jgi:predicted methyltransferase
VLLECNNINTLAHTLWARMVQPGDTCIDATAGNGFDTLALARLCTPAGRVVAMDVQAAALEATRARLSDALTPEQVSRCELAHVCHSQLAAFAAPDSVALVALNLGFLPQKRGETGGATSKDCITRPETTRAALAAAAACLRPGGCISVMVYFGHEGGPEEAAVVDAFAAALPPRQWTSTSLALLNRAAAPRLVLMYKRHCGVAAAA